MTGEASREGTESPRHQKRAYSTSQFGFHLQRNCMMALPTVSGGTGFHGVGKDPTGWLISIPYRVDASQRIVPSPQLNAIRSSK